ncbi:hypothetical protein JS44_15105 [Anoxybacillus flavithermus]|uniref:Uncharacterized protein n=1 Tax=Anoxybacillus flavithermus TaxID=33934 RepID=A0A094LBC8_9BACL|nr:hypothetical protein JS44_15105 [Anoxybacillus flavithermus]
MKGFIEQGHTWAKRLTTFLLSAKQVVEQHGGSLPEEEAKRWERVYDRILAKAQYRLEGMTPLPKKRSPSFADFKNGRKKRCAFCVKPTFPLTTTKPNEIFAWSKSKRTSRVHFVRKRSRSRFASQEASFPHSRNTRKRVGLVVSSVDRRNDRSCSFRYLGHLL